MILNQTNVSAASRGLKAVFFDAIGGEKISDKIAIRIPSINMEESWNWFDNNAKMEELIGEIKIENIVANNYTVQNKEYAATVEVPQAAIETDTLGV